MSTYWYFECLDHDPPLRSDDEFTQHEGDVHFVNALKLAGERPVEDRHTYFGLPLGTPDAVLSQVYFEENARHFLSKHPSCRLGLVNEYGERRPLATTNSELLVAPVTADEVAEERIAVYYYEHSCEWLTKYCDEHHRRTALVPASVLARFTRKPTETEEEG